MSASSRADVGPLFSRLCDDAAIFPPGNVPLEDAVPAHLRHVHGVHAAMVGPLVVAAKDLEQLARVVTDLPEEDDDSFEVAVTVPLPQVGEVVSAAAVIPRVRLAVLEVALPDDMQPSEVVPSLQEALDGDEVTMFVEVPRDGRRDAVLTALAGTPYLAKFRTGGVRSDLYPDETELAEAVLAAVRSAVPFKATAGLHHALRNTDPVTGFEQHGFLNLLAATAAALEGCDRRELLSLLADRDGRVVVERVRSLSPQVREAFRSFGTCSIVEPVEELVGLGLLDPHLREDLA